MNLVHDRRDLRDARVLITGASSGIGAAVAERLGREGARMALLARGEAGLAVVAGRVREGGGRASTFPVDVTDRTALERAVAAAATDLGGIDLVVVAAAAGTYGPLRTTTPEDVQRTLDLTFTAALDTVRAALPALEGSAGTVIVVGSAGGRMPLPLLAPYCAAKHALRGALGSLRIELRAERSPVRISMVHPGPVRTPFWDHVVSTTGRLPPSLPLAASADHVAAKVVRVARSRRPRRDVAVGPGAVLGPAAEACARPASDRVLALIITVLSRRGPAATRPGALHGTTGDGRVTR